ncbi:MAG: hypothetical protein NVS4B13_11280 [Candidatus Elarobacter sp.]
MLATLLFVMSSPAAAQSVSRDATRERVRAVLASAGQRSDVNAVFRQSTKNPYNFVASMTAGLTNAESLEIVVSVTKSDTIGFRVYPHYNGGYINIDKAKDRVALMRTLLYLSDQNFLFWGADDSGDVFCGYTATLESGFPEDSMVVILRSIPNTDKFVGTLRPSIDGSAAR